MDLDDRLKRCPAIASELWPAVADHASQDPQHALSYLLSNSSDAAERVASRTDRAVASIHDRDPTWLAKKTAELRRAPDSVATTSLLGEIRAYADLLRAFPTNVRANPNGCDFSLALEGKSIGVEVYSPQHSERANSKPEVSIRHGIRMELSECAPFGLPKPPKDSDKTKPTIYSIQGEAVSRIAAAKWPEKQFEGHDFYALWMDFEDPWLWQTGVELAQVRPFYTFGAAATSGVFWSAFYGQSGTPVMDSLSFESGDHRVYRMQFAGRFCRPEAVLDLSVIRLVSGAVVYQNPKRSAPLSDNFFANLHLLPGLKPELCWLDWPARGSLGDRVALTRETIDAYVAFFERL